MKRKFKQIKDSLLEGASKSESEIERLAREQLESEPLINKDEEQQEEEGEDNQQKVSLMRVEDYTKEEIDEDMHAIDWEFAYSEVLKVEEKKKD